MVELALVLSVYRFNYDWIFGFLDLVLSILIRWLFLWIRSPGSFVLVQLFEVPVVVAIVVIKVCHIIVIQLVLYLNRQSTKDIYKLLLQIMSSFSPIICKIALPWLTKVPRHSDYASAHCYSYSSFSLYSFAASCSRKKKETCNYFLSCCSITCTLLNPLAFLNGIPSSSSSHQFWTRSFSCFFLSPHNSSAISSGSYIRCILL